MAGLTSNTILVGSMNQVYQLEGVAQLVTTREVAPYTGSYEVQSEPYIDSTLQTLNKKMTANMTVKKIPYETVSNPQGGETVTIGGY